MRKAKNTVTVSGSNQAFVVELKSQRQVGQPRTITVANLEGLAGCQWCQSHLRRVPI